MSGGVYAVASGKGGVGKTTTVVNLGAALRAGGHTVAVVDADLGMANLATVLGVDHEPTLHDVLAGRAAVEEAIVEPSEGFGVVPGDTALSGFADADPARLGAALDALAGGYDFVLVDTGAGLSHEDVLPLGLADGVLLVTTPDPPSIGDARKTAQMAGYVDGAVRGVVVTRVLDGDDPSAIADEIGADLLAAIPETDAVPRSADAGRALESYDPEGAAAAAYRGLAGILAGETEPPSGVDAGAGATGPTGGEAAAEVGAEKEDVADAAATEASGDGDEEAGDEKDGDEDESGSESAGFLARLVGLFR